MNECFSLTILTIVHCLQQVSFSKPFHMEKIAFVWPLAPMCNIIRLWINRCVPVWFLARKRLRDKGPKFATPSELVKGPPASIFFSNHIDFDPYRYSLIWPSFSMYSTSKSRFFEYEKIENKMRAAQAQVFLFLIFVRIQVFFYFFRLNIHVQRLNQVKKYRIKWQSMRLGEKHSLLADFFTLFQRVANFCTLPRYDHFVTVNF